MKKVIHNIRQRPDHHKNQIIWIAAGAVIVLLLVIWAIVGNGRKDGKDQNFFQTFNTDVEAGKNTLPADPLNETTQP
jgi:hypothetical protein